MTTSDATCYVYIVLPGTTEFVTAGRFQWSRTPDSNPIGQFVYGRHYRDRNDALELDPVELRLRSGTFKTARMNGIFGALRDAMPDAWGRRVIERHAGIAGLEEFHYLLEGPDDRAGALGFGRHPTPPAPKRQFNRTLELENLQQLADSILADDTDLAGPDASQAEDLLLLGTSMGGARPKAVVEHEGALWIAKFSRQDDRWNHPRIEHGMLQLAQRCNITVADSRLDTIGERDVLLVRRFDRDPADDGYFRHRMVSALTLLQADENSSARDTWSYLGLADEIRRASANPQADLEQLFARMCFNAATSNNDDHPRNHALLARGPSWRLSPAYDLMPTPQITQEARSLAMHCGTEGRRATRENLLSGAGRFMLNQEEAAQRFRSIIDTVHTEWYNEMRRAGVTETDCQHIRSAFEYRAIDQ